MARDPRIAPAVRRARRGLAGGLVTVDRSLDVHVWWIAGDIQIDYRVRGNHRREAMQERADWRRAIGAVRVWQEEITERGGFISIGWSKNAQ